VPQLVIGWIVQAVGTAWGWTSLAIAVAKVVALGAYAYNQKRRADRRARDAHNASLEDRMVMVDVQPDAPATLALGRVRAVEGIHRRWQSGTHDEKLTIIVGFAGHEIDAFEKWYLNDTEVTLDGSGWVQTAPWLKVRNASRSANITLDGSGGFTYDTGSNVVANSQQAVPAGGGGGSEDASIPCSISGNNLVVSGGSAGGSVALSWQTLESTPVIRIRPYLGAAGQNVGAAIAAEYPGKITATDKFSDGAVAVVDLLYDPDIFPQGVPNITALFRGAKVYDPRTGLTAWSENPALLAWHYFRHPLGWDCTSSEGRESDVIAAANECDISTVFTLRKPDNSTTQVTLPRYRCGITINTDADPRPAMDEIFETMAGKWGWAGGTWRMRAGRSAAPVFTLTESWIAQLLDDDGLPASEEPVIRITNGVPREQKVNSLSGRCVDPDQRWQILPFPAVSDAALITEEGRTYPLEVEYQGVNHIAHAQHLCKITIREAQASLRLEAACNLNAYRCELFDVGTVTLPRYGFDAKLFEVTGWRWHPTQGVVLNTAETESAIYDTAELTGRDPAPNSSLPPPTTVPNVTGLAVASGTAHLLAQPDGTLLTRARVTWTAVSDERVRVGGQIEVRWGRATTAEAQWQSEFVDGVATEHYLLGIPDGALIVVKLRAINGLARGNWTLHYYHAVVGKTALPANASGFTYTLEPGGVRFSWTRNEESDVQGLSELHLEAVWNNATAPLFDGVANTWVWRAPPLGTHTVLLKHRDTTGNRSATAASVTFTVDTWVQQQVGSNLLDPSQWAVGTTGTQGPAGGGGRRFDTISAAEDSIVLLAAPDGTQRPVWWSVSGDAALGNPDGGWITGTFPIDSTKMYRFSVWVRPSGAMDGAAYLGVNPVNAIGGGLISDPFFVAIARGTLVSGRWYLFVGYVFPSSYAGSHLQLSGHYDGVTGQKLVAGTDFRWVVGQTTTYHRGYQFDASSGAEQAFWGPRVDLCDGNEPTLGELLAVSMSNRIDAAATVALVARGNCQVVGNTATKVNGVDAWDSDVYSRDSYTGGAFASVAVAVVTNLNCFFGLNSDPTSDQNYTSLDYSIQLHSTGAFIYESGTSTGVSSAIAIGDVFAVVYDGANVRYLRNGAVIRTTPAPVGVAYFFDSSFNSVGSRLTNIQFGPLTTRPRDGEVLNFRAVQGWEFARSTEGWVATGATVAAGADAVTVTSTGIDPTFNSPAISIAGSLNDKVRVRIRRVAGSGWQGTLYYETSGHGNSESFKKDVTLGPGTAFEILEWDMTNLTAGGTDWVTNVITRLRFDFGNSAADVFEVDWIAVGKSGVAGDLAQTANVTLVAGANGTVVGNSATKLTSDAVWNWHVYSRESYSRGVFASASPAQNDRQLMFGLNADPTTDESYTSIDYAMFASSDGTLRAYRNSTDLGQIGTYVAGDALAVVYDGVNVRWVKNGSTLFTDALASSATNFFFDSSFYHVGGTLRNITIGPMSGVFDVNTGQIVADAITEPFSGSATGPSSASSGASTYVPIVNFTPSVDCDITIIGTCGARKNNANKMVVRAYRIQGGVEDFGTGVQPLISSTDVGSVTVVLQTTATAGSSVECGLRLVSSSNPTPGGLILAEDMRIIVEVKKR